MKDGAFWLNKLFLLGAKKLLCLGCFMDETELLFVLLTVELWKIFLLVDDKFF